ncbi:hypothetical protein [Rhodococcus qingshengii]|uniref:hypothetical protein n=1 Tax=Rhodococcus qingshengii TaxID=334542 RepID=UPI001F1455A1|nr:hypothetical protein [Rhodococcus qingshengii]ULD38840.1 hypothetical protein JKI97_00630 [Rhodococcus qingshengii]
MAFTDVEVGDVIRYDLKDRRAREVDDQDYLVRGIDTEGLNFGAHRFHVTVIKRPLDGASVRTIGDVTVRPVTTRIVDGVDPLLRSDKRHVGKLVAFVDSLDSAAGRSL